MIWDTERPYHYARWTRDHRLIIGGREAPSAIGGGGPAALAAAPRLGALTCERVGDDLLVTGRSRRLAGTE